MKPVNGMEARINAANHVMVIMIQASLVVTTLASGFTMVKYFSMLMAVRVNRDEHENKMFKKPFKRHKLSTKIQLREKLVMIENGIQNNATPMSAHARLSMNRFVSLRNFDLR